MKSWAPAILLAFCVPLPTSPKEALKREVIYNSLHRSMLPQLPLGSICDVQEIRDAGKTAVACHLQFHVDLDDDSSASLRAALRKDLEAAGVDPDKPESNTVAFAAAAGKRLWFPHLEAEAKRRYAALQESLEAEAPELQMSGTLSFTLGGRRRDLMRSNGDEWRFVSP